MSKAKEITESMSDVRGEFIFSGFGSVTIRVRMPDSSVDSKIGKFIRRVGGDEVFDALDKLEKKITAEGTKEIQQLVEAFYTMQESIANKYANKIIGECERIEALMK